VIFLFFLMSFESQLLDVWAQYIPVIECVERHTPATAEVFSAEVRPLIERVVLPAGWQYKGWSDGVWCQDALQCVRIPYAEGKSAVFVPRFEKDGEGRVWWASAERSRASDRKRGWYVSGYDDASLIFEPRIKPAWEGRGSDYARDMVTSRSGFGTLSASMEDGSGQFVSSGWADAKRNGQSLGIVAIVRLGYGNQVNFDEMYAGYQYVHKVSFAMSNVGKGELDALLAHLGTVSEG